MKKILSGMLCLILLSQAKVVLAGCYSDIDILYYSDYSCPAPFDYRIYNVYWSDDHAQGMIFILGTGVCADEIVCTSGEQYPILALPEFSNPQVYDYGYYARVQVSVTYGAVNIVITDCPPGSPITQGQEVYNVPGYYHSDYTEHTCFS